MRKSLKNLLLIPVAFAAIHVIQTYFKLSEDVVRGLLGGIAGLTWWSARKFFDDLRKCKFKSNNEVKIFNDQLKMFSQSVNTIGVAFFIGAIARPILDGSAQVLFSGLSILLSMFGFYFVFVAHRVLEFRKEEDR